jgi:hypothetical protein
MSEIDHAHFGRCPCSGVYDQRFVEVRLTVDQEVIVLTDVSQGACPLCGSRVYKLSVLEEIERTMRGDQRWASS